MTDKANAASISTASISAASISAASISAASISAASISTASIAQRDKQLMDLQHQIELKEAQLKQDYERLRRDVKHNPYLQVAINEYSTYLKKEKEEKDKKIKALTHLLQYMEKEEDKIEIKREIMRNKRK